MQSVIPYRQMPPGLKGATGSDGNGWINSFAAPRFCSPGPWCCPTGCPRLAVGHSGRGFCEQPKSWLLRGLGEILCPSPSLGCACWVQGGCTGAHHQCQQLQLPPDASCLLLDFLYPSPGSRNHFSVALGKPGKLKTSLNPLSDASTVHFCSPSQTTPARGDIAGEGSPC